MNVKGKNKKFLKIFGYVLLSLSFLFWTGAIIAPFVVRKNLAVAITPTLIIIGEVSFYLSIVLLGKEIWHRIKGFFTIKRKKNLTKDNAPE